VRLRLDNAVLRNHDARRVVTAQFIAMLGFGLAVVALPLLVLDQGGSAALSGLVAAAGVAPYVLFGLYAGAIGDRVPRRRLLQVAYLFQAACAATIPIWSLYGTPPFALIISVAFFIGLGRAFVDAAVFGAIADVVSPENFIEGQAVMSVIWSSGQIFGPFVGGALVGLIGGSATILVQTILLLIGAGVVTTIRSPLASPPAGGTQPVRRAMKEGLEIMIKVPMLRLLTIVATIWFFSVMGIQGLFVAYYKDVVGMSVHLVGLTLAVGGFVGLAGSLAVRPLSRRFRAEKLIAAGVVGSGCAVLLISLAQNVAGAMAGAACFGFTVQITTASFVAERQRYAPHHLQSRVGLTGRAIVLGAMMAGGFTLSALATTIPLRGLFAGVGIAALLLALWAVPAIVRAVASAPTEASFPTPSPERS
jgi:MFS family permease